MAAIEGMEDVASLKIRVGGLPAVMRYLLEQGLLDGSCMTVTGKTVAENLESVAPLAEGQDVIRPVTSPNRSPACPCRIRR